MIRALATASLVGMLAIAAYAQPILLSGYVAVVDGDTLRLGGARVRLYGIDAPETGQRCNDAQGQPYRCGLLASSVLEEEIAGRPVVCSPRDVDRYGRTVAICNVDGRDLGEIMVRRGWAVEYRFYSDGRYAQAEGEAAREKRGMWAGTFDSPMIWRAEHRR